MFRGFTFEQLFRCCVHVLDACRAEVLLRDGILAFVIDGDNEMRDFIGFMHGSKQAFPYRFIVRR
jgi:hypothetical protein